MTTSNKTIERADIVMSDLNTNGGTLSPEQANMFIDYIMEEPTILRQVRVERMNSPTKKINRMGFGSRIMHIAPTTGGANDDGTNDRILASASRAKVTTSQIELVTYERIVEVHIPYEVLEDNLEGAAMESHIMRLIAKQVAIDCEEVALFSDTATVGDDDLAAENGWLKRISAHIVDNASAGPNPDLFANALLALPQKYLRNLPSMRAFISEANRIRYQQKIAERMTGYGDAVLQNANAMKAHGLQLEAAPMLAADGAGTKGLVTDPKNLIWAIRRDISIETEKNIRSRQYVIVLTLRSGLQVDDTEAAVKLIRI